MRDIDRIPVILGRFEKIWKNNPDLRLGQLILNVINESILYYLEDDVIITEIENFYFGKNQK